MSTHPMRVRSMAFDLPDYLDPIFVPGQKAVSALLVASSLALPHLEPYLIRTMSAARAHIEDASLLEDLQRFSAQEGHHYRAHKTFNERVRLGGFPELARFEAELEADYRRFTDTKSLRFNLAYAEGFEALSMNLILLLIETEGLPSGSPVEDLWGWHFIEEIEHRTVAFDVYQHLAGTYRHRLVIGAWAQWHFFSWVVRVARYIHRTNPATSRDPDPGPTPAPDGPAGRAGRAGPGWRTVITRYVPRLARIYLPSYTPHAIPFTPQMRGHADRYTAMAARTR
jgi:uncharacterized protein